MNIFLDIDGVMLGRDPATREIALAQAASNFLNFAPTGGIR